MDERDKITYFAETDSRNKKIKFGIKAEDRLRHIYSIGKTGMGKSTFLENMAIQDIQNGEGMAFMDPHGKTADLLLDYIPEHRIKDVIYFAPFDTGFPISFNVMEDVGPERRYLVVAGLMSAFEKIWEDAWSARMAYILQNTLAALLEYPGATLLGVNRMYTDKAYRTKVVDNIKDPSIKAFWTEEYAKYTDRYTQEATPAIQNKIGQFASNPLIRNVIGQPKSSFDIRKIMDEKKILIVNLSKGLIGEGNANLLGSMLVTKMYLAAMSRADASSQEMAKLPNFYLYVDEFQSFANKSFADILSEARKYKLSLNITHQYIEQMPEEVRAAVFGNVGTMITFRVGSYDAEILEKEFTPVFTMEDIVNLGRFQIYLKLMIDQVASQPFSATTLPAVPKPEISYKDQVLESSRSLYAKPKPEVEEQIRNSLLSEEAPKVQKPPEESVRRPEVPRPEPRTEWKLPPREHADKPRPVYTPKIEVPKPVKPPEPKENVLAKAIEAAMKEKTGSMNHELGTKEEPKIQKQEPVSLNTLKKEDRNKSKDATPEHKHALAEALKVIENRKPQTANEEKPAPRDLRSAPVPNEVPEEVLRKVLQGDTNAEKV